MGQNTLFATFDLDSNAKKSAMGCRLCPPRLSARPPSSSPLVELLVVTYSLHFDIPLELKSIAYANPLLVLSGAVSSAGKHNVSIQNQGILGYI